MRIIKNKRTEKKWSISLIFTTILVALPLFSCANELFIDPELFSPTNDINTLAILISAVCAVLFLLLNKKIESEMTSEDKKKASTIISSMGYKPKAKKPSIAKETAVTCIFTIPLFYFGIFLPAGKIFTNTYGIPYESQLIVSKTSPMSKACIHAPYINSNQLNGFFLDRPLCISSLDYKNLPKQNAIIEVTGMKSIIGHTISNYTVPEPDEQKNLIIQNKKDLLLKEWKHAP